MVIRTKRRVNPISVPVKTVVTKESSHKHHDNNNKDNSLTTESAPQTKALLPPARNAKPAVSAFVPPRTLRETELPVDEPVMQQQAEPGVTVPNKQELQLQHETSDQPASWQPKGFSFRPFRRASM